MWGDSVNILRISAKYHFYKYILPYYYQTEVRRKEQLEAKKASITQLKACQQKLRVDILELNRQTEDLEAKVSRKQLKYSK